MKTKTKSPGLILTLAFLSLLVAINAVLFNVAFPNISRNLHLASSQVSWIAIGYSMVVAIGSIIYDKLADAISLRKLFLIGIGLFILGSLAFSFISVGIALAIGLGPLIAGALISRFSWPIFAG